MEEKLALEAIQKKLTGKRLNYQEIFAVMDQISHEKLGPVLTTYFAASGYSKGFNNDEIYYLTKAMIETGESLEFKGIVADKHSIGGVPGTRTTMIVVPIVAAAGFTIPKSSSRAITSPGGTADDMEVLSPVTFNKQEIYKIVAKTNGCIVWGGGVDIAPADDELIKVEEPLLLESYDKILVSIVAKKVAFGSNHVVIDLPYGDHVKVHKLADAQLLKSKFEYLAERFNMKMFVNLHKTEEPSGRGIGPLLETREALRVLEQGQDRPLDLEKRSLLLAGILLDLCLKDASSTLRDQIEREFGGGTQWAASILATGHALKKMREIIKAQGGNSAIMSKDLKPGKYAHEVIAAKADTVKKIDSKNASMLAKILGAPTQKKSGIYLHKKIGEEFVKNEPLYTLHSESEYNLKEAKDSLSQFPVLEFE